MLVISTRTLSYIFALAKTAIFISVFLVIVHFLVLTIFLVEGASMYPNLVGGQVVLVDRISYNFSGPHRGDMVVLRYPGDPEKRFFVKRIVALPGEQIVARDGKFSVNGRLLIESYLGSSVATTKELTLVVPPNEYYTLGDNRPISNDSRIFGATPKRFLIGRVIAVLYPFDEFQITPRIFY